MTGPTSRSLLKSIHLFTMGASQKPWYCTSLLVLICSDRCYYKAWTTVTLESHFMFFREVQIKYVYHNNYFLLFLPSQISQSMLTTGNQILFLFGPIIFYRYAIIGEQMSFFLCFTGLCWPVWIPSWKHPQFQHHSSCWSWQEYPGRQITGNNR